VFVKDVDLEVTPTSIFLNDDDDKNYVHHRRPLFNGNISVTDCMPLSSLV